MVTSPKILLSTLTGGLILPWLVFANPSRFLASIFGQNVSGSQAAAPSDSEVRDLQQRLKALEQQLNDLKAANDPAVRRRLMQQNWQGMQDYMARMHERWVVGFPELEEFHPGSQNREGWLPGQDSN